MKLSHLRIALSLSILCGVVTSQSSDIDAPLTLNEELIEHPTEPSLIFEGSGNGETAEYESFTTINPPVLEELEPTVEPTNANDDFTCPEICACHIDAQEFVTEYVVDCSKKALDELPSNISLRTTTLNLQENNLKVIPKSLSALANLKILDVSSNLIADLELGSISELADLVSLKLNNNSLTDFPQDLKNGFGLTKLEVLDFQGNDIATELTADIFATFVSLRKITVPENQDIHESLCSTVSKLETVCVNTCAEKIFECPGLTANSGDELLIAKLPGTIALSNTILEDKTIQENNETSTPEETSSQNEAILTKSIQRVGTVDTSANASEITDTTNQEADVRVGANTSEPKDGGISKSIIGIVVAGMIVIVAGVVVHKNWNAIKKKFSSSPRPANGNVANGISPEEVPLQHKQKSPV